MDIIEQQVYQKIIDFGENPKPTRIHLTRIEYYTFCMSAFGEVPAMGTFDIVGCEVVECWTPGIHLSGEYASATL